MTSGRTRIAAIVLAVAAAAGAGPSRPGLANTPAVAQTFENLTHLADATIKQLEQAAEQTKKDLEQMGDKKLVDRVDKATTTEGKVDAINDRLGDRTGVDKSRIPGSDAKPEEIKDFIDRQPLFGDYIQKALRLRALLRAIEAWKKLRAEWNGAYKEITGNDVKLALGPAAVRNPCTDERFAYSAAGASTTLAPDAPKTDIGGAGIGYADASFAGGAMRGAGARFGLGASVGGGWNYRLALNPKFSISTPNLGYAYGGGKVVDSDRTIAAAWGCPAAGTDVVVGRPALGELPVLGQLFAGGAAKVNTVCHKTQDVDLGGQPRSIRFERMPIGVGYACPSDPAAWRRQVMDWATELGQHGVSVDPQSAKTFYFGTPTGRMGYCGARYERYTLPEDQCAFDLGRLVLRNGEIGQERVILPTAAGGGRPAQVAQARPRARTAGQAPAAFPNDRYFHGRDAVRAGLDDQWGLKRLGFAAAPADGRGSLWPRTASPVLVAVVDSGVDASHPDLAGALWANPKEIPGNSQDDDGNGFIDDVFGWNFIDGSNNTWDNNGHGTFVAGVIAARTHDVVGIAGVNPWARILPVKVTDFHGKGDHLYLAQGIYYAAEMGARVINVSVGGKRPTLAEQYAIDFAARKGALVVVAAGNDGADIAGFSPAGALGALTVAATDDGDRRAGFSNYGAKVDVAAPGVDILSLRARQTDLMAFHDKGYKPGTNVIGPDRMYYRLSGTSFSAPFVAGLASLLFSIDPSLTAEQVRRMILQSARDIDATGHDPLTGYGLLDAAAALKADPNRFIDARIAGVDLFQRDGRPVLVPSGTAAADRFKRAWLEVGRGGDPADWARVADELTGSVENGPLAPIPIRHFAGPGKYTVKLVVEHADGARRETRHEINLR
jgi:subtilisin family serine protease